MPIMPTFTSRWKRRAACPLAVKIAVPFAKELLLISSIASSSESTRTTVSTGPKISSV